LALVETLEHLPPLVDGLVFLELNYKVLVVQVAVNLGAVLLLDLTLAVLVIVVDTVVTLDLHHNNFMVFHLVVPLVQETTVVEQEWAEQAEHAPLVQVQRHHLLEQASLLPQEV
jgi:hypothetical protein